MKKRLRSALAVTLFLFTSSPLVQAESGVQPGEIQQLSSPTESPATPIPFAEIGAKATADYQGDAIGIEATADGARLRTGFQKLAGTVTAEGLQLESTAEKEGQLKLTAAALRRGAGLPTVLPVRGSLSSTDKVVAFIRPGIIEEYSVSVDGLRQDFIVTQRPEGAGDLSLELALTGAVAEAASYGAKLTLDGSGRTLAYSRLHVTDAQGKELTATMEVLAADRLAIRVEDAGAAYPLRIDPTFSDADWVSLNSGIPGANGTVYAAVVDGSGNLYIGGDFTLVGSVLASRIAKWDGTAWSELGTGMSGSVRALVMNGTDLYAGGGFTTAGGVTVNRVAKWNGSVWSALGAGMNGGVVALAVSGTDLYAGGSFTTAGGISANFIAKWDGSAWSALGAGVDDVINSVVVSGSDVYAGGYFTTAGGVPANLIARWNGSVWSALGTGLDGGAAFQNVTALAVSGTDLYAGGTFTTAGGVNIGYGSIAKWNGSVWSALTTSLGSNAEALAVVGTDLYAGASNGIKKWNGSAWSAVGTGVGGSVTALAVGGGDIYAGGWFTTAGGVSAQRIAKWNGSAWSAFGTGMDGNVQALAVSGSNLYAGGGFITAGGVTVNRIAKWDGSVWSALGTGMNDVVLALTVSGSDVYAGGFFTTAGGVTVNRIAKWDGSVWSPLDTGMSSIVRDLEVSGTDLYAGGEFITAGGVSANRIAKWNGSVWSALGTGMDGSVYQLAVSGSDLYAGGGFTTAGGVTVNRIAKWSGSVWTALSAGMNSTVRALEMSGSDLYAGGDFTTAGGVTVNRVAKWNGSVWSALGAGSNGTVSALEMSGSELYAGGFFTTAGGVPASCVAKWDGSAWSPLGSGVDTSISALAVDASGHLFLGGGFTFVGTTTLSPFIAQANLPPPAPTVVSIVPSTGGTAGGTSVTITGMNFSGTPSVTIGSVAATSVVVVDATTITCLTPAGTGTNKDVVVTVSGEPSTGGTGLFSYLPPTVASIAPTSGSTAGGTSVTITGTNFGGTPSVTIGNVAATSVVVNSATSITCTTPAGTAGAQDVVVTVSGQSSTGGTGLYTYNAPPTVASIFPTSGSTAGGTSVTITGTNFSGTPSVTIGGNPATSVVVNSATSITCATPAGTAGARDVVVTVSGQSSTGGTGLYTYIVPFNVALSKPVIRVSSEYATPAFSASKVTDGSTFDSFGNNYWITPDGQGIGAFFTLDLQGVFNLTEIRLRNTNNTSHNDRGTGGFRILASNSVDGSNQLISPQTILTGTLTQGSGTLVNFTTSNGFTAGNYRYLHFIVDSLAPWAYTGSAGLNEIEAYGVPGVAAPTVTPSTANLAQNATTLTITGAGFSTTPGDNTVAFSPAGTGTVTASTATSLTVTSLTGLTLGALNAVVTTNSLSSGAAVQVATVVAPPVLVALETPSGQYLAPSSPGHQTPYNPNQIYVQDAATTTGFTPIKWNIAPYLGRTATGNATLKLSVWQNNSAATISVYQMNPHNADMDIATPVSPTNALVDMSTAYRDQSASLRWRDQTGANIASTLVQSDVVNKITTGTALATQAIAANSDGVLLSITIPQATVQAWLDGTLPPILVLTSTNYERFDYSLPQNNAYSASRPLPTMELNLTPPPAPTVTSSAANLASNATTLTINGTGFSTTPGDNTVAFSPAGTGTVTASTATSLTVTGITGLTLGALNAVVTTNSLSSGAAVQVATVVAPAPGTLDLPFNPNVTGGSGYVTATAILPDGRMIIGGNFTTVGGAPHANIARLNADGSVDATFTTSTNSDVRSVAVQADGKLVLGGTFTSVNGSPLSSTTGVNWIARLNADGSRDTAFNAGLGGANATVNSVVVQADGKLVLGGDFTIMNGSTVNRIARLNADGTLDTAFNAGLGGANATVWSVAVQADGKLVIGGSFTSVNGSPVSTTTGVNRIARLNADGTLDTAFNAGLGGASDAVTSVAVQPDGKLLLGGFFLSVNGTTSNSTTGVNRIARLNADGTRDTAFNAGLGGANGAVYSVALQADGKLVLGGNFTTVNGSTVNRIARLNADGTRDTAFNAGLGGANSGVNSVAVRADGKLVFGGTFTSVNGTTRNALALLTNDAATQSLSAPYTTQVVWTRGGAGPELGEVTFEQSTDGGSSWTPLGAGTRVGSTSNWRRTGLSLPTNGHLRARGRTTSGYLNGGSGLIEQVASFTTTAPPDYTVTTTGNAIVVTDNIGNGDVLTVSQPSAGNIRFAASGRTFSVDGGVFVTGDSGDLSRTNVTSITVNADAGNDTINIGAFTGTLPSLTVNGDADADTVNLNGDVTFTAGAGLSVTSETLTLAAGVDMTTSGAGTIMISADDMVIASTGTLVSASTVNLKPLTAAWEIDLGTNTAGKLGLTDTELDRVTAGTLIVGDATCGQITLSTAIGPAGTTTLSLITGAGVTQASTAAKITVTHLAVRAVNSVSLDQGFNGRHAVSTLAARSTGGGIGFRSSLTLTVGTVDGLSGLNAGAGGALAYADTGNVVIQQPIVATGGVFLHAWATGALLNISADVTSGGSVFLGGDRMIINNPVAATSDCSVFGADTLDLGSATDAAAASTELSDAELDFITISTPGGILNLQTNGDIVVSAALTLDSKRLRLSTAVGTIDFNSGSIATTSDIELYGEFVTADASGTDVTANKIFSFAKTFGTAANPLRTTVGNLSIDQFQGGGGVRTGIYILETDSVSLTNNGLKSTNAPISLTTSSGSVTLSSSDVATTGTVSLTAGGVGGTLNVGNRAISGSTISLTADDMTIGSIAAITASTGAVTLAPITPGRPIDLGTNTASQLGLTEAELDRITAGTLAIGDANSGAITLSAAISRAALTNVNLNSGSNIAITTGSIDTAGGDFEVNPGGVNNTFSSAASGTDVSMSTTGTLRFGSGDKLGINFSSATVAQSLSVVGNVNLNGAVPSFTGTAPDVVGTFTLIDNDDSDPITGTFTGLAEGATLSVNGTTKVISYVGGTGNDVVITPLSNVATLANLVLTTATLNTGFSSGITSYNATVPNATLSVTATPTVTHAGATVQIRVNGGAYSSVASTFPSGPLALLPGPNPIDVLVTAQNGTTTLLYTVVVTRTATSPVSSAVGDVVTANDAPDETGANSGLKFDVLRRGGYLSEDGKLVFPGYLLNVGGPAISGLWKDDGSGLKLLARSGIDAPETGTTLASYDVLPQTPAINDSGEVTFLASLAVGSGTPVTTVTTDTALWSEVGSAGLSILMRESDAVPTISGATIGAFASGCYATAHTSGTTGEAAFAITMKGATTDTAILRASVSSTTTAVQVVARENTNTGVGSEKFGNLAGGYTDALRMDATGNLAFVALTKPSARESLWYQPAAPAGGAPTKVFMAGTAATGDVAPGTVGATFKNIKSPAIGSGGVISFRGQLNLNGDNATNLKNDGIWRGTGSDAVNYQCILRRGDDNTNRAGFGLPAGAKVGNLWGGWLTNANHGAWRGWLDVNGNGVSSTADGDVNAIYSDLSGVMKYVVRVGGADDAPGMPAGAKFAAFDLPVVGGVEQMVFLGNVTGGGTTAANNSGIWRSAPNGGALSLVVRTGDVITTTQGSKTIKKVDFPGSEQTDRRWEQSIMDSTGRLIVFVTFMDGSTSHLIVP